MTQVLVIVLALLIGVIAGLRAMTAPAVVAWGAMLGWIDVDGKWSQWVAHPITVTVLTIFLLVELVTDQLPKTPSRKTAPQFATRLIMGAPLYILGIWIAWLLTRPAPVPAGAKEPN